jgi:Sulfotransferase domain
MTVSIESFAAVNTEVTRAPDFFMVGHSKCGTSALYEMLRAHPQVFMPELKEPALFATDVPTVLPQRGAGPLPQTLSEYLALFAEAGAEQRVGEATSLYLWSHAAAAHIAKLAPRARIIAVVREPASFLHSLHMQLLQNNVESEPDLWKAIELEPDRRQGKHLPPYSPRPQALFYSERVKYVEQLSRYHALFPPEQVLVLIYDEFRDDNEGTVRKVLRFLDVDDAVELPVLEVNRSVRVRSHGLHRLLHTLAMGQGPVTRATRAAARTLTPQQLDGDAARSLRRRLVYGEPSPPDARLMGKLRRRFQGEVRALSEYLDRDLIAPWGYDHLD